MTRIAELPQAHPRAIRQLHWAMALGLFGMIGLGLYMGALPLDAPGRDLLMRFHLVLGLLVLAAAGLRLRWRLQGRMLSPPASYGRAERALVQLVHGLFYVLMFALPLLGLAVWLLDPFVAGPGLAGQSVALGDLAGRLHRAHYLGAWLLLAALFVHTVGALRGLGAAEPERRVLWRMLMPGRLQAAETKPLPRARGRRSKRSGRR